MYLSEFRDVHPPPCTYTQVLPLIKTNISANEPLFAEFGGRATGVELDWKSPPRSDLIGKDRFDWILGQPTRGGG